MYKDYQKTPKLTGAHIRIILIIEIAKIKLNDGHFGIMLFIEIAKIF